MQRTSLASHPCSIARALDAVGEWWTPLIVRDVAYGVRRFGELQEDLGISANVLADRLDGLVAEGILETHAYQERPQRSEYRLTEKGAELIPALLALMQWGDRYAWPGAGGPVRVVHDECGAQVQVEVRCGHCERGVSSGELRAVAARPPAEPPHEGEPGSVCARRLNATGRGIHLAGEA